MVALADIATGLSSISSSLEESLELEASTLAILTVGSLTLASSFSLDDELESLSLLESEELDDNEFI